MTDLPHDPLDELASAHLDGQTSPDEARQVADDPGLQARVEQLRAVRDAVRSSDVAVDAGRRDAAIAAALAAADTEPVVGAGVTSLDAARRRRSTRVRFAVAGVAAAAIAAAIVVPQLRDDDRSTTTVASESAGSTSDDRVASDTFGDAGAEASTTVALGDHPGATTAPAVGALQSVTVDLGGAPDLATLGRAVRAAFDSGEATAPATVDENSDTFACLTAVETQVLTPSTPERPIGVVQRGIAQIAGDRAVVVVYAVGSDASYVLTASKVEAGCVPLGQVTLAPFTVEHPAPVPPPGSVEHPVSGDDPSHPVPPGEENP